MVSIYAVWFFSSLVVNLIIIAFGSVLYRIDRSYDVVCSTALLIGVIVMVTSGVLWIIK